MTTLIAAAVTSFVICFLIIPVIIKYSLERNLVDIPGRRKIHKKVTPSMGGIAIFAGFFIGTLIWTDFSLWKDLRYLLIALFVIFFLGVRDDIVPLKPYMKLLGQLLAGAMLIFLLDLRLDSLFGLLGIYSIPLEASYALTLFTIVVITNSFNLIDGLDGLAGTLAVIALLYLGIWFHLANDTLYAILCFGMLGSIVAFLLFNWEPSEIFMGDTGALVIGILLSVVIIRFLSTNELLPEDNPFRFEPSISIALAVIIIPLVDTSRIFILRLLRKQSPFTPDKSHVHHSIMRLGLNHSQTTVLLGGVTLAYLTVGVIFRHSSDHAVLPGLIAFSAGLSVLLDVLIRKRVTKETAEP